MNILHIADHSRNDNDDEGAIAYALEKLGHHIICVQESIKCGDALRRYARRSDFLLFHKWHDLLSLRTLEIPKVFWYFDLVDYPDTSLSRRCQQRKKWMADIIPFVDVGFCTDGDWVNKDKTGKLVRLTQGMDERVAGYDKVKQSASVLFAGARHGGKERRDHIAQLKMYYHKHFRIVDGLVDRKRVHGRVYANLLTSTKVTVAPIGPITDYYWSNRVYLTTGLGGFLVHPYAGTLTKEYTPGTELTYYHTVEECTEKIDYYLSNNKEREELRRAGYERTIQSHLYRHRCEVLLQILKERGIS